ncbi:hypothetical protein B0A49_05889 [Cryomyces minteri]|uniref:Uncharacterized protein n=1 Tax=Cryomyces minteri TaxID=331657 RepID=A0A4U0WCT6_9PEZI|nr:hypothetical protein B0A49_05889 [Cryomyces minteri]
MPGDPVVSTGRGGAGNIGADPTVYTDGGIVREGVEGVSGDAEYSTGRGGAGNIGSPSLRPSGPDRRKSADIIPEISLRSGEGYENFHTGRGGGGNVYREKYGGHSGPQEKSGEGLGGKVKHLLGLDKKDGAASPLRESTPS